MTRGRKNATGGGSRASKVGEVIRQELSDILMNGAVKDPRYANGGLVTITEVKMSPDLSYATAYVSVFSDDPKAPEGVMAALAEAKWELRKEVGSRLTIRHTPDLRFSLDTSAAYGQKIETLLKEIGSSGSSKG